MPDAIGIPESHKPYPLYEGEARVGTLEHPHGVLASLKDKVCDLKVGVASL